ncbi:hypothetical protein D2C83_00510 [Helicobacter pylori]|nr:hypothetical protein [Helicobacter pylori]QEF26262.1 hypothetical protein D2C83_00510 [Helicobacter pylori]
MKRFVGVALIHFLEQNQKALGVLTFKRLGILKRFKGKSSQIPPVNETLESCYRLYLYPTHR